MVNICLFNAVFHKILSDTWETACVTNDRLVSSSKSHPQNNDYIVIPKKGYESILDHYSKFKPEI